MSKTFIKTNEGHIYKVTSNNDIFIKVSPYSMNEDRRKNRNDLLNMISENKANFIKKNKALEEINSLWRNYEKTWFFCGNVYKITKDYFRFNHAKEHKFEHRYVNYLGEETIYHSRYFLCMFHGKLCWIPYTQYYPQMEVYKFTDIDTEPNYEDFLQWTNVKNLKNIYRRNYDGKWEYV